MQFYEVYPEVAGDLEQPGSVIDRSVHPPIVSKLHYEFGDWPEDALITSFPCFILKAEGKEALEKAGITGVQFDNVRVSKSEDFEDMYPDRDLPKFVWLKPGNRPGVDDFGVISPNRLIISARAVQILRTLGLDNAEVEPYDP